MDRDALLIVTAFVLGVGALTLIPTGIVSARLWRALRSRHPEAWAELGRPQLEPMSIGKSRRLRSFIRSKAYEELADPEISSYARYLRVLNVVLTIAVWIGAILVVALAASAEIHAGTAMLLPCYFSITIRTGTTEVLTNTGSDSSTISMPVDRIS